MNDPERQRLIEIMACAMAEGWGYEEGAPDGTLFRREATRALDALHAAGIALTVAVPAVTGKPFCRECHVWRSQQRKEQTG